MISSRARLLAVVSVAAAMALSPTFGSYSAITSNEGNTLGTGVWGAADVEIDNPGALVTGTIDLTASATTTDGSGIASVTIQRRAAGAADWTDVCADTTSPYSCSFNSASVDDGLYDFRATASTDAGGSGTSTAVTDRRVDNTDPSVTITDPGAWFPSTVPLSSTSSDGSGSGVVSVRYEYKVWSDSTWTTACTGGSAPFSCSFDASALTEGQYYHFRAVATDAVNRSTTSAEVTFRRLDKTLPAVAMSDPGANLRGTVTLSASASDTGGSGLAWVTIQRSPAGAGSWTDVCTDTTSPYTCSLNTTTVDDGLYDFRAIARDDAGNETTSAAVTNRRIDNTAPDASIDDPGPYVRGVFTLTAQASDSGSGVGSVQFQYALSGGSSWSTICTDTSAPYSCAVDGSGLDLSLDFRVIATDVAGNQTTSSVVTTTLDSTNPTAGMGDPGTPLRGSASLTASASDNNVVASVTIQHKPSSGSTWTDACTDTSSPYSCELDTTTLADGLYDFRAIATDGAGNTTTSTAVTSRRIDNTGPAVTMTDPGEWFGATKTLASTSSDAGSGVASVTYRYKLWSDVFWTDACTTTTSPYSCSFDASGLTENASYDFHAVATDAIGNETVSATVTRTVRFDTEAPTGVTMDDPGTPLSGSVTLAGAASDSPSGINNLTFQTAPAGTTNWTTACTATVSPYSCSLNTTTVADGSYDMRAVAQDLAGNTAPSAVHTNRMIDNTNPSVTMTNPGAWFPRTVTLSSTSSDGSGSGVVSVRYEYKVWSDSTWTTACTGGSAPFSCSFDASALTEGQYYDFRAVATDAVNRSTTSAAITFRRLDKTAPTASMTAPAANLRGTVTLGATGSDTGGSGLASMRIQRSPAGAGTWTDVCTDATSPYFCSLNTTTLSDGLYDFRAIARDGAGNETTSAAVTNRRIDNTAPDASIDDPGPHVRGVFTLTAQASDSGSGLGSVQFQYKLTSGSTWTNICTADTSAPYSCAVDGSGLDLSLDFRVIATDVAGNQTTSNTVTTTLDSTNPTASMGDPGTPLRGSASLTASASDNNVVASVTIQHKPSSGSTWTDACTDTSSPYSCSLDTTTLADGLYDFRAIATDGAGNTTTSTAVTSRRIDNTGPSVTMTDPGEWYSATETLASTSSDAGSGVASVTYRYKLWSDVFWTDACTTTSSPYSCAFDPSVLTDGATYDFHAVATDVAGNTTTSASWTRTVRFDTEAPTGVTMDDPGTPLSGSVTLAGAASDSPSGVKSLTFQTAPAGTTNWANACTATSSPYSCSFNTATLADGSYDFRALAEDQAGNTAASTVHTNRMIDNNAPTVTMTDPGANLRQTVTLGATASDGNGITSVVIQRSAAGAGSWTDVCTDTSSPYSCSLDTTGLADGLYDFRAVATDGSGRAATSAVLPNRRVDNSVPAVTMSEPGAYVRATVTVAATASDGGSGVGTVLIQRSPTGANTWTEICTDATSPYSCSWNTTGVAGGQYDLRAVATDLAGNQTTSALVTTTVDNTAPTGTNIQTANGGATVGVAEQGDSITFTYSEEISASSLLSGWDGTSTAVTLRLNDSGGSDTLEVYDSADSTRITLTYALAALALNGNYVPSGGAKFNATMVKSGNAITVTLGTLRSGSVRTAAAAAAMSWRPSGLSTDLAGNACSTTALTEPGGSDAEF